MPRTAENGSQATFRPKLTLAKTVPDMANCRKWLAQLNRDQ
jgi:hypothetical protein